MERQRTTVIGVTMASLWWTPQGGARCGVLASNLVNTCCEELTSFTWQASCRTQTGTAVWSDHRAWDTLLRAEERETVTVIAFNYKVNECKQQSRGPSPGTGSS